MKLYNDKQLKKIMENIKTDKISNEEKLKIANEIYLEWLAGKIDYYLERKERECFESFAKNEILINNLIKEKINKISKNK